jgi:heme/copper-type cytochrome/quinol oxidase subunit 3
MFPSQMPQTCTVLLLHASMLMTMARVAMQGLPARRMTALLKLTSLSQVLTATCALVRSALLMIRLHAA